MECGHPCGGIRGEAKCLPCLEPDCIAKQAGQIGAPTQDKDEYCELVRQANEPEIHGGSVIHRHAHGVVSICAPLNYPIEEIVLLAIPALIAGNAIVVKPSEVVPLSSGAVVRCLQKSLNAAQPGLVGLVQGDGTVGSYLQVDESLYEQITKIGRASCRERV